MTASQPRIDYSDPKERGAETLRMPDGSGYALAICDYGQHRVVTLMRVTADDLDETIHEHVEVIG